ncbi:heavy-metal-associated domain-containing protein [Euryhalocaulis caribicus]|uniref:heavy-metal-associated domain-containing protein n=1 Tax=Euryhalocaulis caribicus TaxID=1161401 RepID=UPI00039A8620|nr:cation transporter [Euryhalocaulis caribicus]
MIKTLILPLALAAPALAAAPPPASAAGLEASAAVQTQRVKFAIENMTCATCPITVKTAIKRVRGVQSVEIDFEQKTAIVLFDPSVATVSDIASASTKAGYPAQAIET